MNFIKTKVGDGESTTITLKNAFPIRNFLYPKGFVRYKNNPIITAQGVLSPGNFPNIYASDVHGNPVKKKWEMFYAGWDEQYTLGNKDFIYLAESGDGLKWNKKKYLLGTSAQVYEDMNINDPSVLDIPEWNMRIMLYTCAGNMGIGKYTDQISLAKADIYGDNFVKYNNGQPIITTLAGSYRARPSILWNEEKQRVMCWYDYAPKYGDPVEYIYCEISYDSESNSFSVENIIENIFPSSGSQAIDVKLIGNKYYAVEQGEKIWISDDGIVWTNYSKYTDLAGEKPAYEAFNQVTPMLFVDKIGILRGIYYGNATVQTWDRNQISLMMLMKTIRIKNIQGEIVKSTCCAKNWSDVELDISGLDLPYSGIIEVLDEEGTFIHASYLSSINSGDEYELIDTETINYVHGTNVNKIKLQSEISPFFRVKTLGGIMSTNLVDINDRNASNLRIFINNNIKAFSK